MIICALLGHSTGDVMQFFPSIGGRELRDNGRPKLEVALSYERCGRCRTVMVRESQFDELLRRLERVR